MENVATAVDAASVRRTLWPPCCRPAAAPLNTTRFSKDSWRTDCVFSPESDLHLHMWCFYDKNVLVSKVLVSVQSIRRMLMTTAGCFYSLQMFIMFVPWWQSEPGAVNTGGVLDFYFLSHLLSAYSLISVQQISSVLGRQGNRTCVITEVWCLHTERQRSCCSHFESSDQMIFTLVGSVSIICGDSEDSGDSEDMRPINSVRRHQRADLGFSGSRVLGFSDSLVLGFSGSQVLRFWMLAELSGGNRLCETSLIFFITDYDDLILQCCDDWS